MVREFAIRSFQRGIGCMDYIETLLIIQNQVPLQYSRCHSMPQEVKKKCCKLKRARTPSSQFTNLCLDPDVVEHCIKNTRDIRNNRENNSSRNFHHHLHFNKLRNAQKRCTNSDTAALIDYIDSLFQFFCLLPILSRV